jgi:hypothetical protein
MRPYNNKGSWWVAADCEQGGGGCSNGGHAIKRCEPNEEQPNGKEYIIGIGLGGSGEQGMSGRY